MDRMMATFSLKVQWLNTVNKWLSHCILGLSWFCMSVEQIFQQVQLYTKGQGGISSWILCISYHLLKRFLYGFYFWMDQVS